MKPARCVRFFLALLFPCLAVCAETPEERAKVVRVTLNLTEEVPPAAVAQFVEAISKVKVHYTPRVEGEPSLRGMSFENATVDDALRYLAQVAGLELSYQADGAYLTPKK